MHCHRPSIRSLSHLTQHMLQDEKFPKHNADSRYECPASKQRVLDALCRAANTTLREYDLVVHRGPNRSAAAGKREQGRLWEEVQEKWHALQHLLHKRNSLTAARKGKGKASTGDLLHEKSCESTRMRIVLMHIADIRLLMHLSAFVPAFWQTVHTTCQSLDTLLLAGLSIVPAQ